MGGGGVGGLGGGVERENYTIQASLSDTLSSHTRSITASYTLSVPFFYPHNLRQTIMTSPHGQRVPRNLRTESLVADRLAGLVSVLFARASLSVCTTKSVHVCQRTTHPCPRTFQGCLLQKGRGTSVSCCESLSSSWPFATVWPADDL